MALTRAILKAAMPGRVLNFGKTTVNPSNANAAHVSNWKGADGGGWPAGANPSGLNGTIPDRTTTGALPLWTPAAGKRIYVARFNLRATIVNAGAPINFADRLWHNLIDLTTGSSQAITQPALTRATSGEGVELWAECYAGTTGGTANPFSIAVSYTNQDGTPGRAGVINWTPNAQMTAGQSLFCELAEGDTGVRSVQSATVSDPRSGGALGLFLAKPMFAVPVKHWHFTSPPADVFEMGAPALENEACLFTISNSVGQNSSYTWRGEFNLLELDYP